MPIPVSVTIEPHLGPRDGKRWSSVQDETLTLHIKIGPFKCSVNFSGRTIVTGATVEGEFDDIPPLMRPGLQVNHHRLKRLSMKQEAACAESVGGHRQQGSGARPGHKGDGRVRGRYRIENKFRTSPSITVKLSELRKIRSECAGAEVPVFDILFREKGTLRPLDNWVLLPKDHWEKLANADAQANNDR